MKHVPRKRFGQNFLNDQSVLDEIIRAIDPKPADTMVEIGPGQGAMTALLLAHLSRLHVIEIDRDLVVMLQKKFTPDQLIMHAGDALQFDIGILQPAQGKLRIVGNLPYNISSPLLFHLAKYAPQVEDQHFMLQKEVVERMVASPGGRDYGRLSVMLQWRYEMEMLFVVPPAAFYPPPKVDSAIVRMRPRAAPLACDPDRLSNIVMQAFSQRRKVIRNSLSALFTEPQLIAAGIDPQARPETIALAQFVALAHLK